MTIIPPSIGGGTGVGDVVIDGIYLDNTPRVLFRTAPNRPLGADPKRETITVEFTVGKNGSVVAARVVESSNARYDDACLNAVKRWRFEPGMRKNVPVPFRMQQTFVFTTRD
jgi:periplasmic protein TonB